MESLMLASYHFRKLLDGTPPSELTPDLDAPELWNPLPTFIRLFAAFAVPFAFVAVAALAT